MKVFFHAQLRGPENYLTIYRKIYKVIEEQGYQHTSNIINSIDPKKFVNQMDSFEHSKRMNMYATYIRNIKLSDIIVVEVSLASFTAGFLIHEALIDNKPIVALYLEGNDPYHLLNMNTDKLQLVEYNTSNIREKLQKAFDLAKKQIDIRFNFFIPPEIISYLDWISAEMRISKSTYIRDVIVKDMKKNKQYLKIRNSKK